MLRLLHLADTHLGSSMSPFRDMAEERRRALLDAFRELPTLARSEEVHAVLVAGDLFDRPNPDRPTRAVAAAAFETLTRGGCPVFVVPGNHDSPTLHPHPYTESLGGAHVFLSATFERKSGDTPHGPLHVYGLAYDRAEIPDPLETFKRSDAPGFHVVLLHGSAHFSPHWGLGRNALQLPLEALRRLDCDYIALGDYHRFRPPLQFSEDGEIPACYPGSFAALNLREEGPKGYVVVELEAGKAPVVSHRCSSVAPLQRVKEIDVSGAVDHNGVVQKAAAKVNEGALPIVRLTGVADFPLDVEFIRLQLQERFGFAHVEDASTFYSSHRLDELAAEDTVRGYVVRLARKRIESAADVEEGPISEEALRLALQALGVT